MPCGNFNLAVMNNLYWSSARQKEAGKRYRNQEPSEGGFLGEGVFAKCTPLWLWRSGCQMYCWAQQPWVFLVSFGVTLNPAETTFAKAPFSQFLKKVEKNYSGLEKELITKGVFSLEESLASLKSLNSLESLKHSLFSTVWRFSTISRISKFSRISRNGLF